MLVAILSALAGVLILNHGSLPSLPRSAKGNPVLVPIDGVHRQIAYLGPWTGYEGPSINDSCALCPVSAQVGGVLRIPVAFWHLPTNTSLWIFTNVTGPFPVELPSCSPAPCTFPWVKVWSWSTFVPKDTLTALTLFATFELPNQPPNGPNIIDLNATFCPVSTCAAPP